MYMCIRYVYMFNKTNKYSRRPCYANLMQNTPMVIVTATLHKMKTIPPSKENATAVNRQKDIYNEHKYFKCYQYIYQ